MAAITQKYGPKGLRIERIHLKHIDTESPHTGWRKPKTDRQETLKNIFLGGQYGLSVTNGIQILEKESEAGQKLIDDGVSTVCALKACAAIYAENSSQTPDGDLWPGSLVQIFQYGLNVRVVADRVRGEGLEGLVCIWVAYRG